MQKLNFSTYSLLCGAAVGVLLSAHPAAAQTDTQIQSIEQQIQALQSQLGQVKSDLASRDSALAAAQKQAKAAQAQAAAATAQATQATQASQAAQAAAAAAPAPVAQIVAAPVAPTDSTLPPGAFHVGGITVTLGGFAAAEGITRSRNEAAGINSTYGGIPFANSPNYHIPEFRLTAQQSRFSMLTEGQIDPAQKITGYLETDFLSGGSSSNSNESNSYTLRMRQFWGSYDNTDQGWNVLGGQAWSLATMYKSGLTPRQENVPLTIDAQYVVGFDWARQAQVRVSKDFYDQKLWAGLSIESPQTTFGSGAGPNCLTGGQAATGLGGTLNYAQCGGPNENSIQSYSDNIAPDIIAKIAADPGWGHYEIYGLLQFMGGRVSYATTGTGQNHQTTGAGIGGGMILPLIPRKLDFQVSGLIGQGVGRYASGQLADATFSSTGAIEPLTEYSVMGGFVGHPIPTVDLYGYGGAEGVTARGLYGAANTNLSGCQMEMGSCAAVTSGLVEGTVGGWWRIIHSNYGTVQAGLQYEYINRNAFAGVGAVKGSMIAPTTNDSMFLFSLRYLPFL